MPEIVDCFSSVHEGKIWKLYSDPFSDLVLLEERNEESREVLFYVYNVNDFSKTKVVPYEKESWWIGVHDFQYGICIFHLYQDGIEPVPQGVLVYDLINKEVLFESEELRFKSRDKNILHFVDDGHDDKEIDLFEFSKNRWSKLQHEVIIPRYYNEDSKHYQTLITFFTSHCDIKPIGAIEYLEFADRIILSVNRFVHNKLENILFIVTDSGDIEYQAELTTESKGIGMGTFFLLDDFLWFVQNKNKLRVLQLT